MNFFHKLNAAIDRNDSLLCVGLDPTPEQLPDRYRTSEDLLENLLAWNRAVIQETQDLVCAFKPNIAFYEALGERGMALLRRTLALIPPHIPLLLDAKRGDIGSTAAAYARACFDQLGVDGVTLSPYLGRDSIDPFAAYPDKGLFVLCHTSNPGAAAIQGLPIQEGKQTLPLYLKIAQLATSWAPNVGLVVGATYPEALAQVRALVPDRWFLAPGVGAQGGDLAAALAGGLRKDGRGLLISVTRGVTLAEDHRAAAAQLRERIRQAQGRGSGRSVTKAAPRPRQEPISPGQRALVVDLFRLGAIQFGQFTLASGLESPIYIDLRLLVSAPRILARAAQEYARILAGLPWDRIAGVPYAALPIGTAVALAGDAPLIYPRKEAKEYGLAKAIEGAWQPGERVVIIEDLITSGGSTLRTAERLRAAGLEVTDAIVLIDRQQGGVERLAQAGITAHSVFTLTQILDILVAEGLLGPEKRAQVLDFIRQA